MLGYFDVNASPLSQGYYQYYYAAMRIIEKGWCIWVFFYYKAFYLIKS